MFIYDFIILSADLESVARAFREDGAQMLLSAALNSGSNRPQAPRLGELRTRSGGLVLSVDWDEPGWEATLMGLQGEIEFSAIDDLSTHLSVSASWDSDGTSTYSAIEQSLRRRQAEQVIRTFIASLAQEIATHGTGDSIGEA